MTANPKRAKNSSKVAKNVPHQPPSVWIPSAIVTVVTCMTFLPVLGNQFVNWDDYENLISNPSYRGLGWSQISWMFTTFYMGHYQPLSWLTLGLDYLIWGMNPVGYHLTSLTFHAGNAVIFYFVGRRLLAIALRMDNDEGSWRLCLSAALAALLFAIHPLRVESVAWATERRDVLAGFFFLWTIYCYLRATLSPEADSQRRWFSAAVVFCILSLLL